MLYQRAYQAPSDHRIHRPGDWLPGDHRVHKEWLDGVIEQAEKSSNDLHPVLKEFKCALEGDTRLFLLVNSMFEEIPSKKHYDKDPTGHKQVRDYQHMLELFNHILTAAPEWSDRSYNVGMVGTPLNAVLDWPMGTPSGFAFFLNPVVNKLSKKVLNTWAKFLAFPASAYVLSDDAIGWFSNHGIEDLTTTANVGSTSHKFEELFICDPSTTHYGYKSWDDFFTRHADVENRWRRLFRYPASDVYSGI